MEEGIKRQRITPRFGLHPTSDDLVTALPLWALQLNYLDVGFPISPPSNHPWTLVAFRPSCLVCFPFTSAVVVLNTHKRPLVHPHCSELRWNQTTQSLTTAGTFFHYRWKWGNKKKGGGGLACLVCVFANVFQDVHKPLPFKRAWRADNWGEGRMAE